MYECLGVVKREVTDEGGGVDGSGRDKSQLAYSGVTPTIKKAWHLGISIIAGS